MARSRKSKAAGTRIATGRIAIPRVLLDGLAQFERQMDTLIEDFVSEISATAPALIYHYTDDGGLRGILESGNLRFTDVFNLNDPSELRYGVEPALEAISEEANHGPPEVALVADALRTVLRGAIERVAHFFVCCFSTADDDLGQWRAYAHNGRGYALEFDGPALENSLGASPPTTTQSFPVTYGPDKLEWLQQQIVGLVLPLISAPRDRTLPNNVIAAYMSELSTRMSVHVLRAALFFKHQAYDNEKEYRFLQLFKHGPKVPDLKYRARPYQLVRYREIAWRTAAPNALRRIIVGPAADWKLASQFAEQCLREFHPTLDAKAIGQSLIPYRAT
jgi:hypothetical protein